MPDGSLTTGAYRPRAVDGTPLQRLVARTRGALEAQSTVSSTNSWDHELGQVTRVRNVRSTVTSRRDEEPLAVRGATCYASVMPIRRITISVPEDVARRIKKAAADSSVSAWVTSVIEERLDDVELDRMWREFYDDVAPRRQDVRRADSLFKRITGSRGRKRAA